MLPRPALTGGEHGTRAQAVAAPRGRSWPVSPGLALRLGPVPSRGSTAQRVALGTVRADLAAGLRLPRGRLGCPSRGLWGPFWVPR